ncbi:hypothetical protein INT43_003593 [Umbelopsis isabellina]|uniref:GDP/GTP exchange factor Sec2 N-terminal domain-containing protein n=1 Tax=Mortierella isabellina TaxID=91625 RepID=A0A8H7UEB5_MORIS|nr:hypothetical protein INT43_003593 [Umbelopsis isabellina]
MKDVLEPLASGLSIVNIAEDDEEDSRQSDAGFEEDVLPFLLQAQDVVSRLESRVMELEEDLFTIHSKYECDRSEWMIGLQQKDVYIEYLTQRLQKLEYSSRQAILLLSETEKDTSGETADLEGDASNNVSLSLSYLRQAQQINEQNHTSNTISDDEHNEQNGDLITIDQNSSEGHDLDAGTSNVPDNTRSTISLNDDGHKSHNMSSSTLQSSSFCSNCKQLLEQLDHHIEEKAFLKRDLKHLAATLVQEQQTRADVSHAKESLESDVDELGRSLIKVLNQIIMEEAGEQEALLRLNRQYPNMLSNTIMCWESRHQKLLDMKDVIFELDSAIQQSSQISGIPKPAEVDAMAITENGNIQYKESSPRPSNVSEHFLELVNKVSDNYLHVDGRIFTEFTDHIKATAEASKTEGIIIPPTTFMKRIMREDIEPCLFADASGTSWWRSSWYRKKLIDNIATGRCEITQWRADNDQQTTPSPRLLSQSNRASQFTASRHLPPKTKCASCGRTRVCEFRMRLHPTYSVGDPAQLAGIPWLPIDRFCRDRLVAVCDFYGFISYLKQGLMMNVPALSLFKQCLQHLRNMAVARVGSIALFEAERKDIERPSRKNRESIVLDHAGSDSGSSVSVSELTGIAGPRQIVIVH